MRISTVIGNLISGSVSSGAPVPTLFISATGDDVLGNGTLANPWSLQAFNSKPTNNPIYGAASYSGQAIGLLPGLYQSTTSNGIITSIYSLIQSGGGGARFVTNGGTPGNPTYICCCDTNGNYLARSAKFDCAQPGTGTLPTVECALFGQSSSSTAPPNWGYVVFDGLEITHFTSGAITLYRNGVPMGIPGCKVINCHLHDNAGTTISGNNPSAIGTNGTTGIIVNNNLLHDLTSTGSFYYGFYGFLAIGSIDSATIQNNTTYNCAPAIGFKDTFPTGTMEVSYNYLGANVFGNPSGRTSLSYSILQATTAVGATQNIHHNICTNAVASYPFSSNVNNQGTVNLYNNTWCAGNVEGEFTGTCDTASGVINLYNNLTWNPNGYGTYMVSYDINGVAQPHRPGIGILNNNVYGGNSGGVHFNISGTISSFAQMRGLGYELNGVLLSATGAGSIPYANGVGPDALANGAPDIPSWTPAGVALTTGQGGTPCGALNASGLAADGSGKSIGCNFAASTLAISTALRDWQPGLYFTLENGGVASGGAPTTSAFRQSLYQQVWGSNGLSNPQIIGVMLREPWGFLEHAASGTSFGQYTLSYSQIDQDITYLASIGKYLAICPTDYFSSSGHTEILPSYLYNVADPNYSNSFSATGVNGGPGYYDGTGTSVNVTRAAEWVPAVRDRIIALHQGLAALVDGNPTVTAILMSEETDHSGLGPILTQFPGKYTYTDATWKSAQLNLIQNCAAAWVKTPFAPDFNQLPTYDIPTAQAAYNAMVSAGTGFGGPDIYANPTVTISGTSYPYTTMGQAAFAGALAGTSSQVGKLPGMYQVQDPDYNTGTGALGTAAQRIATYCVQQGYSYVFWMKSSTAAGGDWATVVLPVLQNPANKLTQTAYPSGFPTGATLPNATVGVPYSAPLSASGGSGSYAWNIESASPNKHLWLYISASGNIFGTPQYDNASQGNVPETVVVRLTDTVTNASVTATFTINIVNP